MKKIIYLSLGLIGTYFIMQFLILKPESGLSNDSSSLARPIQKPSISVVFFQDVSGTIKRNGVEIISSSIFEPYFKEVNRNIELYFGIVDDLSSKKLISVILPARNFIRPVAKEFSNLSLTKQRREKQLYATLETQYIEDSTKFYLSRSTMITEFCRKVDSLSSKYRNNLSKATDLITAIDIADKVFNYSEFGATINYLLLNSDGLDTFNRRANKLKNKAIAILINAGIKRRTSVDSIIATTLQSPEQAIQFTLNN